MMAGMNQTCQQTPAGKSLWLKTQAHRAPVKVLGFVAWLVFVGFVKLGSKMFNKWKRIGLSRQKQTTNQPFITLSNIGFIQP